MKAKEKVEESLLIFSRIQQSLRGTIHQNLGIIKTTYIYYDDIMKILNNSLSEGLSDSDRKECFLVIEKIKSELDTLKGLFHKSQLKTKYDKLIKFSKYHLTLAEGYLK